MIGAKPSVSQHIYALEMCHGASNLYRAAHICANLQWNAAEPTEPSPQSLCAMCKVQSARVKSRLIFGKAGQHKISLLSASPPWWQRSKSTLKSRIGGSVGLIEISLMRKIPGTLSLIVSGSLPWGPAHITFVCGGSQILIL